MRTLEDIQTELGAARRAAKRTDNALKANCGRAPWGPLIEAHRLACEKRRKLESELREATRATSVPPARKSGLCQRPGSDLPEVCQNVSSRIA